MENLLRPHQREEMLSEQKVLQNKLHNPYIQDKGAVNTQLRRINKQLETQTPKPFAIHEVDSMVKRERELRETILCGMPSQEEMRKAPPGAIGKHTEWEKRNKAKLNEWKNIRLRLDPESHDPDIANFERYRPTQSSLNMENAQIPGKQYYLPTEAYKQGYEHIEFGVHEKEVEKQRETEAPTPEKPNEEKGWSQERRAAHAETIKKRHAEKKGDK